MAVFELENVESGIPASFDSVGNISGSATATLDTSSKISGVNSIKFTNVGDVAGGAIAKKILSSSYSELYIQFKCFIENTFSFHASGYTVIFAFHDSSDAQILAVNLEDWGTVRLTLWSATTGWLDTGITIPKGTVFKLEIYIKINSSTGNVKVWLDNNTSGSPDYDSGNVDTGSSNVQNLNYGMSYAPDSAGSYYMDDFIADTGFLGDYSPLTLSGYVNSYGGMGWGMTYWGNDYRESSYHYTQSLVDYIVFTDPIRRWIQEHRMDGIALSDSLTLDRLLVRYFADVLAIGDNISLFVFQHFIKMFTDGISVGDIYSRIADTHITLTDAVQFAGNFGRTVRTKIFTEALLISEATRNSISKMFAESLGFSDYINRLFTVHRNFVDNFNVSENVGKSLFRAWIDQLSVLDFGTKSVNIVLGSTLFIAERFVRRKNGLILNWEKIKNEAGEWVKKVKAVSGFTKGYGVKNQSWEKQTPAKGNYTKKPVNAKSWDKLKHINTKDE